MTHARAHHTSRRVGLAVAATLLAVSGAACGGSRGTSAQDSVATFDRTVDPAGDIPPVDATRSALLPAADLHALLDALLSEHSALGVHLMRAVADGSPAHRSAVTKSLAVNTESLTGAIGLVYGPDGARAFDQLWKQHIQFFADYAAASTDKERAEAMADLHDYKMDFSSFTATATGGLAPLDAVVGLLHTHIAQLTAASDAYREHDYAGAVEHQHEARLHMYEISAALAGAISGQQPGVFPGKTDANADALLAAQARTEAVQLRLDGAWSAKYRPGLVPSITAEMARLEARTAVPQSLALTAPDPTKAVAACVTAIANGALDAAMTCGHEALAAAAK